MIYAKAGYNLTFSWCLTFPFSFISSLHKAPKKIRKGCHLFRFYTNLKLSQCKTPQLIVQWQACYYILQGLFKRRKCYGASLKVFEDIPRRSFFLRKGIEGQNCLMEKYQRTRRRKRIRDSRVLVDGPFPEHAGFPIKWGREDVLCWPISLKVIAVVARGKLGLWCLTWHSLKKEQWILEENIARIKSFIVLLLTRFALLVKFIHWLSFVVSVIKLSYPCYLKLSSSKNMRKRTEITQPKDFPRHSRSKNTPHQFSLR